MAHLRSVHLTIPDDAACDRFPFSLPCLADLSALDVDTPVTIFVGENGSGKSTLMEALACALDIVVAGSEPGEADPTLDAARPLSQYVKPVWNKRTRRGFFLRAEDYFGYVKRLHLLKASLDQDLAETQHALQGRSPAAQMYGQGPLRRELHEMDQRYDGDLDQRSHGESFLDFFQARVIPGGLYLLDEPEAALSPTRQLSLIALINAMAEEDAQFIIATHSPILLALPGARLLSFDHMPIQPVAYDELEHVRLMRSFMKNPEQYLRYL